jgi:glutaredoxin 3
MKDIEIYTTPTCGYCHAAKRLLASKGASFREISVTGQPDLRQEMMSRSGRHTVPQIFIGGVHVGGCDDLFALERSGKLDPMIAA